jgi:hypothetical protein
MLNNAIDNDQCPASVKLQGLLLVFAMSTLDIWGHAVARLVEALHYKPEGCGFNSR